MRLWSLSWSGEGDEVAVRLCWACSEVSEAEAAVLISILHGPRWLAHAKAITYRTHSLSLIHLELPPALWPPLLIPSRPSLSSVSPLSPAVGSIQWCTVTPHAAAKEISPTLSFVLSRSLLSVVLSYILHFVSLLPCCLLLLSCFLSCYCFFFLWRKKLKKKKTSRRNLGLFSFSFYLFLSP